MNKHSLHLLVTAIPPHVQTPLMWGIFILTYVGIALGEFPRLVLDRTGIAILGAILMLVVRGVTVDEAAHFIDKPTMLLLFGLMVFSAQLRVAGFPVIVSEFLADLADRPRLLLAGIIATSAVISALLANDIVCLAFTPLLCEALLRVRRNPLPYLVALATSSNIGSAATLIGNPQNMYIGSAARLPFGHFTLMMLPPVLAGLVLCWLAVALLFRRELGAAWDARAGAAAGKTAHAELAARHGGEIDTYLITKTLIILLGVVTAFVLAGHSNNQRAVAAIAGAGVLLTSRRTKAARLYAQVDFNLLLLFIGLFVVNGAMQEQHLTDALFGRITASGVDLRNPVTLSIATLGLSNVVSNVPAVLLLQPILSATGSAKLWYLLALVSTWAGNLTLVGSIANLIVAESAAPFGVRLDLKTYCRVGVPLTLVTVALGTAWIMLMM